MNEKQTQALVGGRKKRTPLLSDVVHEILVQSYLKRSVRAVLRRGNLSDLMFEYQAIARIRLAAHTAITLISMVKYPNHS